MWNIPPQNQIKTVYKKLVEQDCRRVLTPRRSWEPMTLISSIFIWNFSISWILVFKFCFKSDAPWPTVLFSRTFFALVLLCWIQAKQSSIFEMVASDKAALEEASADPAGFQDLSIKQSWPAWTNTIWKYWAQQPEYIPEYPFENQTKKETYISEMKWSRNFQWKKWKHIHWKGACWRLQILIIGQGFRLTQLWVEIVKKGTHLHLLCFIDGSFFRMEASLMPHPTRFLYFNWTPCIEVSSCILYHKDIAIHECLLQCSVTS